MAVISQTPMGNGYLLRVAGAFIAIFSLAMGLLFWFVLGGACTVVSSLQLLFLGFFFVVGLMAFLAGTVFSRKNRGN